MSNGSLIVAHETAASGSLVMNFVARISTTTRDSELKGMDSPLKGPHTMQFQRNTFKFTQIIYANKHKALQPKTMSSIPYSTSANTITTTNFLQVISTDLHCLAMKYNPTMIETMEHFSPQPWNTQKESTHPRV
jgi:hypothetical protein